MYTYIARSKVSCNSIYPHYMRYLLTFSILLGKKEYRKEEKKSWSQNTKLILQPANGSHPEFESTTLVEA